MAKIEQVAKIIYDFKERVYNNEFKSMHEIDDACYELANKNEFEGRHREWMLHEAYSAYIIHCEVEKIIPVSGY